MQKLLQEDWGRKKKGKQIVVAVGGINGKQKVYKGEEEVWKALKVAVVCEDDIIVGDVSKVDDVSGKSRSR